MSEKEMTSDNPKTGNSYLGVVGISTPSERELVAETADAYCPECGDYIVNERVTYEECCDSCGTEIEWHE
jgi:uncharacterized protein (DUF983 family)